MNSHRRPRRQRGVVFVPAMVCLVLVSLFCAALLRQSHARRTLSLAEEHRAQAEWLAESALGRASARLAAETGYTGETWDVPPSALNGRDGGVVRISVEPVKDQAGGRKARLRVEADYPRDDERRARSSKTVMVDLDFGTKTPGGPK